MYLRFLVLLLLVFFIFIVGLIVLGEIYRFGWELEVFLMLLVIIFWVFLKDELTVFVLSFDYKIVLLRVIGLFLSGGRVVGKLRFWDDNVLDVCFW